MDKSDHANSNQSSSNDQHSAAIYQQYWPGHTDQVPPFHHSIPLPPSQLPLFNMVNNSSSLLSMNQQQINIFVNESNAFMNQPPVEPLDTLGNGLISSNGLDSSNMNQSQINLYMNQPNAATNHSKVNGSL